MASDYELWLTHNNGTEKFRFPVLPEVFHIKKGALNTSVNVQGFGEIVVMQDTAAVGIAFSGIFPIVPFPGIQHEDLLDPYAVNTKITIWQQSDRPSRLILTNTTVNLAVTIEDFTFFERGGDIRTLHFSLVLKQYRHTSTRRVTVDAPTQTATVPEPTPARVDDREPERTHTVARGDNLSAIARRHLGDGSRWPEIQRLNQGLISNPNLIHIGWVLKLPAA